MRNAWMLAIVIAAALSSCSLNCKKEKCELDADAHNGAVLGPNDAYSHTWDCRTCKHASFTVMASPAEPSAPSVTRVEVRLYVACSPSSQDRSLVANPVVITDLVNQRAEFKNIGASIQCPNDDLVHYIVFVSNFSNRGVTLAIAKECPEVSLGLPI
jgi:hypothetical protein